MFDDLIINDSFDIIRFLNKLNLDLFYTKPQFKKELPNPVNNRYVLADS